MRILCAAACTIAAMSSACSGGNYAAASHGFATLGNGNDDGRGGTSEATEEDDGDGPGTSSETTGGPVVAGTSGSDGAAPAGSSGSGDDGALPGTDEGESTAGCIPGGAGPCTAQAIGEIAAIGDDGHVPANAFDGDLATRWSFDGVGGWISFDLGEARELCELRIAWYQGDERVNDFRIEASTDGTAWVLVHDGASSGTTAGLESYALDGSPARWVRVVVLGNTKNDWASISEIETDASAPAVDDCE